MNSTLLWSGALGLSLEIAAVAAPTRTPDRGTCDIKGVYKQVEVPAGALALSALGEPQELDGLLVPTSLDDGAYDVRITRKASNLYRVDGTSVFVVTRYCYEYAYSQQTVMRVRSIGSTTTGTLAFN